MPICRYTKDGCKDVNPESTTAIRFYQEDLNQLIRPCVKGYQNDCMLTLKYVKGDSKTIILDQNERFEL